MKSVHMINFMLLLLSPGLVLAAPRAGERPREERVPAAQPLAVDVPPGVNEALAPTSQALVTAAIGAKADGAKFRASVVPALIGDNTYIEVISEAKLTLFGDTSISLFRASASVAYNPFSLRGHRYAKVPVEQCSSNEAALAVKEQKVDEALFLAEDPKVLESLQAKLKQVKADRAKASEEQKNCRVKSFAGEWKVINNGPAPMVTLSMSVDTFPRGTEVDPDAGAGATRNLNGWGGIGGELMFSWRVRELGTFDLYGNIKRGRPSGASDTELANYFGGGATLAVLAPFISEAHRWRSTDYVREGFLPGVALGASVQYRRCDGGLRCEKLRVQQHSVSPLMDLRLKPALQFRLSLPIVFYDNFVDTGDERTEVVPTLSIAGQLVGL